MNEVFDELLKLSVYLCILIPIMLVIERISDKNYSKHGIQIFWMFLCIRMLIPFHFEADIPIQELFSKKNATETNLASGNSQEGKNTSENDREVAAWEGMKSSSKENSSSTSQNISQTQQPIDARDNKQADANKKWQLLPMKSIKLFIMYIWEIGVVTYIVIHILCFLYYKKKHVQGSIFGEQWKQQIVSQIKGELQIKKQVLIYYSENVQTPIVIGVIRPKIIMPLSEYSREEFEAVVMHELIHVKNKDIVKKYVLCIVNAIYWFHPFVYLMVKRVHQNMEFLCDEVVVAGREPDFCRNYSLAILATMNQGKFQYADTILNRLSGRGGVKMRFYRIVHPGCARKKVSMIALVCCIILLTGSLIGCGMSVKETKSSSVTAKSKENAEKNIEHFLIVGEDEFGMADSIFVVTRDTNKKTIEVVPLDRSMNLNQVGKLDTMLSTIYRSGGVSALAENIETNLELQLDYTLVARPNQFEKVIDALGGIDINITKEEAEYLNNTNYIESLKNRNLKAGTLKLNGEQALGYVRVRHCATVSGANAEAGRTERQVEVIKAILETALQLNLADATEMIKNFVTEDEINLQPNISLTELYNIASDMLVSQYQLDLKNIFTEDNEYVKEEIMNDKTQLIPQTEELKNLF